MKIYNAKKASVQLPLGMRRLTISGNSLSQEFMPTSQFLQMIARTFSPKDLALIVSGAWEGNMCAEIPTLAEYVVPNVESALARFNPPEELKKDETKVEKPEEITVSKIEEKSEVVESNPEISESDNNEKAEQEKETKKAKRVRTAKRITRKKKTDEEKSVEE